MTPAIRMGALISAVLFVAGLFYTLTFHGLDGEILLASTAPGVTALMFTAAWLVTSR